MPANWSDSFYHLVDWFWWWWTITKYLYLYFPTGPWMNHSYVTFLVMRVLSGYDSMTARAISDDPWHFAAWCHTYYGVFSPFSSIVYHPNSFLFKSYPFSIHNKKEQKGYDLKERNLRHGQFLSIHIFAGYHWEWGWQRLSFSPLGVMPLFEETFCYVVGMNLHAGVT